MNTEDIIRAIELDENKSRKAVSFQQCEIYAGRLKQYVDDFITKRYSAESLREMPIMSSINISKRIINKSSSLYTKAPKRFFRNCSDEVVKIIEKIYQDMRINHHMKIANRMYVAQEQHIVQCVPHKGKLILRNFKMHEIDAIENPENPNEAIGYITSSFDRENYMKSSGTNHGLISDKTNGRDHFNSVLADKDDFKKTLKKYVIWTETDNFIINGKSKLISDADDKKNNLGVLPFVEFSLTKDNEYFVRPSGDLYDFTIQLNAALSSLWQIIDLQGFSMSYLICSKDVMPEVVMCGPARTIKLIFSEESQHKPEFGFASPSPDLAGSREFIDLILSLFLTSRGIDAKTVNSKGELEKYTSGIDRLLAKIEKFEASEDDIFVMENGEKNLFEKIKTIINNIEKTDLLLPEYSIKIPKDAYLDIEYAKPEILKTDIDIVDIWVKKIDARLASRKDAVAEIYNLKDDADIEKKMREIDESNPLIPIYNPNKENEDDNEE